MPDSFVPTPAALRPTGPRPTGPRPATAVAASEPARPASDPRLFGRVEADGTVILQAPEGEIVVGQWAAGEPDEGLAFFGRKYDDLVVEVDLISRRLDERRTSADQAAPVLARVREALAQRSFVGDVPALAARCDALEAAITTARAEATARKAEQRATALAAREALAAEAEGLSGSTSWKATTERYAAIVEEWKALPRADRTAEQDLWARLSAARTAFDKARRAHFSTLEAQRKESLGRKRDLIAQAETLAASTDWAATSRKLRDLMGEWKVAPRGSKTDEDKLWKRFKAAQDSFYAARTAAEDAEQEALRVNVPAKEAIVAEAESLVPVTDPKAARTTLRRLQERWDAAGDLPRADRDRLETRLRRIEETIRKAENESWQRTNPEKRARAESTANAFTEALERMEQQHADAVASGNSRKAADLAQSIASTKALLEAARGAAR